MTEDVAWEAMTTIQRVGRSHEAGFPHTRIRPSTRAYLDKTARRAKRGLILMALGLVGSLLLLSGSAAAWQGAQDNKSPAELAQMAEFELASEGRRACRAGAHAKAHLTPRAQQTVAEAHGYLETLGQRAQQLHGGQLPPWVGTMHQAIEGQDAVACLVAWEPVMKEHLDQLDAHQKRKRPGGGPIKTEPPEDI